MNLNFLIEIIGLLKKHFANRLYFEIQRHNEIDEKNFEKYILNCSKSFGVPLIATQEVFYLDKEMYEAHDTLRCIGEKTFVDDKNRFKLSNQHYFKKNEDIVSLYSDIPEALENNFNFHLRFNFKLKNRNQFYLPLLIQIKTLQKKS